jgi:hypothetical protein
MLSRKKENACVDLATKKWDANLVRSLYWLDVAF